MSVRPDTDDYRALFLDNVPMIDLRAPVEFGKGAFPASLSLPLMSDDERAQVGICYKQEGQQAAIALGHRLVSGDTRARRLAQWREFACQHPSGYLYCWRGGLRSQTVQSWLKQEGIEYPRVKGGYKAMRRFLLEELERSIEQADFVLISGKTGTGKTRVIERLLCAVDLEGLANHRGSSFGQLPTPQPAQIDFENGLSIALMQLLARQQRTIFVEDEGRLIGRLYLPEPLRKKMACAPMLLLEHSLDDRIDIVIEDYVIDLGRHYADIHGEPGAALHRDKMQQDLTRIGKRLGGQRLQQVSELMDEAFRQQWRNADLDGHRAWVAVLLEQYYDPMYEYQFSRREGERLFLGDRDAVVARAKRTP